ncbi:immunity 22 family protein [Xanthomonas fragariae]|uniref:immunity 22 family protein n=1 Tax=Xanthomonas fragariae TaxID=48664 RepID=UPI000A35C641|nr:immunity 22 family protein [Xanthomonas fragariae]SMQ95705.1 hypothetical protein NBC2815_02371 [Xanthomonas fragariae]
MKNDKSIHVWLGVYPGNDREWEKYFDVETYGAECGFCKDTQKEWFDFDKFSAYNAGGPTSVEDVIIEVPYSDQFEDELLSACSSFGITQASHCFSMIDFDGSVTVGSKYNGLTLVGVFGFSA